MKATHRVIAGAFAAVIVLGPLGPRALAQQPAPQPAVVVAAPAAEAPVARGIDGYDVGAGIVTVAKTPFNIVLCALGTGTAITLFALTLGSAYRASTRVVEEGCGQRWLVRGDDLRPRGAPGVFPDRPVDGYRR